MPNEFGTPGGGDPIDIPEVIVPATELVDGQVWICKLLVLLGLGVVWAMISEWFWRISVRRYTSASS